MALNFAEGSQSNADSTGARIWAGCPVDHCWSPVWNKKLMFPPRVQACYGNQPACYSFDTDSTGAEGHPVIFEHWAPSGTSFEDADVI